MFFYHDDFFHNLYLHTLAVSPKYVCMHFIHHTFQSLSRAHTWSLAKGPACMFPCDVPFSLPVKIFLPLWIGRTFDPYTFDPYPHHWPCACTRTISRIFYPYLVPVPAPSAVPFTRTLSPYPHRHPYLLPVPCPLAVPFTRTLSPYPHRHPYLLPVPCPRTVPYPHH